MSSANFGPISPRRAASPPDHSDSSLPSTPDRVQPPPLDHLLTAPARPLNRRSLPARVILFPNLDDRDNQPRNLLRAPRRPSYRRSYTALLVVPLSDSSKDRPAQAPLRPTLRRSYSALHPVPMSLSVGDLSIEKPSEPEDPCRAPKRPNQTRKYKALRVVPMSHHEDNLSNIPPLPQPPLDHLINAPRRPSLPRQIHSLRRIRFPNLDMLETVDTNNNTF